jgi:hypothetical protein
MIRTAAAMLAVLILAASPAARAQDDAERPVTHGPFQPEVEQKVRGFVLNLASNFGGFYPQAQFRTVRAVYFESGAIIVCGELSKTTEMGARTGWRYFSNSGPLIFESDHLETLCDQRTYVQPAFADDHDYGQDFTRAAGGDLKIQASR